MLDFALDDRVIITDLTDEYILEIDLLFNTAQTELIGDPEYGTSFEDYLWRLDPSESELREYINEKLRTTLLFQYYNTNVIVEKLEGNYRAIFCVQIIITLPDNDKKTKTYIYK